MPERNDGTLSSTKTEKRFSFEDELTFRPQLNSLSLKMVSYVNRPSIIQRIQKKKEEDDGGVVNFSFKPADLSVHSSKIVAKMNTCFWDRQNKVIQKRLEMIEQGPSTVHPDLRYSPTKNKSSHFNMTPEQRKVINHMYKNVKRRPKSPYSNSVDVIIKMKKKEIQVHMQKTSKILDDTKILKKNSMSNVKTVLLDSDLMETNDKKEYIEKKEKKIKHDYTVNSSKSNLSRHNISPIIVNTTVMGHNVERVDEISSGKSKPIKTCKNENNSEERHLLIKRNVEENLNKSKNTDNVTYTLVQNNIDSTNKKNRKNGERAMNVSPPREKTNELDTAHQNLLKMKKVAGQVIKKKKVFVCNGPYASLRIALRRRGWIEKHFKCDNVTSQIVISNGGVVKSTTENEIEGKYVNSEESDFMCDNQYSIMSRIVRKTMPIFLWTLKRDDINFQYLHKDQIVNHFLSARSFTTKAGLCLTLNNLRYFGDHNASLFFPRCFRLCCDEDKEDFIDSYKMTTLQSILQIIVEKHIQWKEFSDCATVNLLPKDVDNQLDGSKKPSKNQTKKKRVISSDIMKLILKTSYNYIESKQHADIEENYSPIEVEQKQADWVRTYDCFKCISLQNGIILDAFKYVEESKEILRRMEEYNPQQKIDGVHNIWILKPGAKSRGRGIEVMNDFDSILNLSSDSISKKENRWVIQKYIERPLLVHRTKFDIRQWFLVTGWNPLMLWFYKDSYVRFCGQEFQLDRFDPEVHLSNNSIQKDFKSGPQNEKIPESKMWASDEFKKYLIAQGQGEYWSDVIYPGMKKAIIAVLISSQDSLEYRKNSFELYGADFMLGEDLQPWLIEINASPALGPSTPVTERLCRNVLEDTLKVVLDKRDDKDSDTGRFELAFKRPYVPVPTYMGNSIAIDGLGLRPAMSVKKKCISVRNSITDLSSPNVEKKEIIDKPTEDSDKSSSFTNKSISINDKKSLPKTLNPVSPSINDSFTNVIAELASMNISVPKIDVLPKKKIIRRPVLKYREVKKTPRDVESRILLEPCVCTFPSAGTLEATARNLRTSNNINDHDLFEDSEF